MQATTYDQTEKPFHWSIPLIGSVLAVGLFIFLLGRFGLIPSRANYSPAPSAPIGQLVEMGSHQMAFSQDVMTLRANEPVTIKLVNDDLYDHSFDIDALDIHVPMGPNSTTEFEIANLVPGEYTYYCAVPGHTEAGMVGTLIIE